MQKQRHRVTGRRLRLRGSDAAASVAGGRQVAASWATERRRDTEQQRRGIGKAVIYAGLLRTARSINESRSRLETLPRRAGNLSRRSALGAVAAAAVPSNVAVNALQRRLNSGVGQGNIFVV